MGGGGVILKTTDGGGIAVERPARPDLRLEMAATPNPFNPSTTIHYYFGTGHAGTLAIFDIRGRRVFFKAVTGNGTAAWTPRGLSSGIYTVIAENGDVRARRGIIFNK